VTWDTRAKPVEQDVVAPRHAREPAQRPRAQRPHVGEFPLEALDRGGGECEQPRHLLASRAARVDFRESSAHSGEKLGAAPGPAHELVLEVGIALDRPHLAQHLVEHPGGAPGTPLGAQVGDEPPALLPQQPQHDLAVGERGVVVRNLADAGHLPSTPKTSR
jgi:hypothetical protein